MKSFFAFLLALVFFGAGAFVFLSTGYRDSLVSTSAAPASPDVKNRGISKRESGRSYRKYKNWRKRVAPEQGVIAKVGYFLNDTLNLKKMKLSFVDGMSLMFGLMGTFFTWRSYRIQKQSAEARGVQIQP